MCKYFLNITERGIVKSKTGEIVRPDCIDDLIAYYGYLSSTGDEKAAHHLLRDVFYGEKVISNMIYRMHSLGILE